MHRGSKERTRGVVAPSAAADHGRAMPLVEFAEHSATKKKQRLLPIRSATDATHTVVVSRASFPLLASGQLRAQSTGAIADPVAVQLGLHETG